jgi:hypothetical protein
MFFPHVEWRNVEAAMALGWARLWKALVSERKQKQ